MKLAIFAVETGLWTRGGSRFRAHDENAVRTRRIWGGRGSQRAVAAEVAGSAGSIRTNVNGRELVTRLNARLPEHVMTGWLAKDGGRLGQGRSQR